MAQKSEPADTFTVQNGECPWSDRIGKWALAEVPSKYAGATQPRQNCTSRCLVVPEGLQSVVVGVATKDQRNFVETYPEAESLPETFSIVSPQGETQGYLLFRLASPPPVIKSSFQAGLILFATNPASATSQTATPKEARSFEVPANREKFEIYLLLGQSNMLGRDTSQLNQQETDARIGSLEKDDQWLVASDPLFGGTGTGPGRAFAKDILGTRTNDVKIGLVQCAVGGTPLSRWEKGGDLYQRALERARVAVKSGTLKGVLWHQGESDTVKPELASTYERRLTQMLKDLRADLESPALPVVVGQLGSFLEIAKQPHVEVVRAAIKKVGTTVPHTSFVDSEGLGHKGDNLHFTAEAETEFGHRYAKAMLKLQSAP